MDRVDEFRGPCQSLQGPFKVQIDHFLWCGAAPTCGFVLLFRLFILFGGTFLLGQCLKTFYLTGSVEDVLR